MAKQSAIAVGDGEARSTFRKKQARHWYLPMCLWHMEMRDRNHESTPP